MDNMPFLISPVSYSEDAVIKLQYYTGAGKEGNGSGSAQGNRGRGDTEKDTEIQTQVENSLASTAFSINTTISSLSLLYSNQAVELDQG